MTDDRKPAEPPADASDEPAINQTERDDSGPLGPEDTDSGPAGQHPDPDEYAGTDDH